MLALRREWKRLGLDGEAIEQATGEVIDQACGFSSRVFSKLLMEALDIRMTVRNSPEADVIIEPSPKRPHEVDAVNGPQSYPRPLNPPSFWVQSRDAESEQPR